MDLIDELSGQNWKQRVQKRFVDLKTQIKSAQSDYYRSDSKKTISRRLRYKNPEKDEFSALYQQINDLQHDLFNEDQTNLIDEQTYEQFVHLLMRTFDKVQMYFIEHDMHSENFSMEFIEHTTEVLVERQAQFQRLFRTNTLSTYDHRVLQYEVSLQQRAQDFQLSVGAQESFSAIKVKCSEVFDLYIRQCIQFHSTMSVRGVFENLHDITERVFGQQITMDETHWQSFDLALNYIDIPLIAPQITCHKKSYLKQDQYKDVFLRQDSIYSTEESKKDVSFIDLIKSVRNERWMVLLGSAGSGKTTFVRWLTWKFAQSVLVEKENVVLHDIDMGSPRIPILIRIGEFVQWLDRYPTGTLFDYIGQQTWLGQTYVCEKFEMLKEFVRHGNALIILDGLDEIATFELHGRMVALVRTFMESHCMSKEFVSPFDNDHLANTELTSDFQCEGLLGGNLIVITSRIVNYNAQPLSGPMISHYLIQPMNIDYLSCFIHNWCLHVQDEINHVLIQNIPDIKRKKILIPRWLNAKLLISKIKEEKGLESLASNVSVLSIICMLFTRYGIDVLEKSRVRLYQQVAELMLEKWQHRQLNIPKDALMSLFSNIAFYIHSRLGSGLIDELDLVHLCRLSLQRWYDRNTNSISPTWIDIRQQTNELMQLLSEDAGIVAARSLCIYGFLHLTFQEYFVCLGLVDNTEDSIVTRFLSLYSNPRLREPLHLAMGWISFWWSFKDYDDFCIQLYSNSNIFNRCIPVGSLLFISALADLACLPSPSIVYNILDSLLDVHEGICLYKIELLSALDQLSIEVITHWFNLLFLRENLSIALKMLHIIYDQLATQQVLPKWITPIICEILWRQFGLHNEEMNIYTDRILMMICVRNKDRLPTPSGTIRAYLLSQNIPTESIHSSIFAALISLYGGLEYSKTRRKTSVVFTARRIHRDSSLSSILIEYMNDTITNRVVKIQNLIEQCHKMVMTATSRHVSLPAIYSLVVLFCFHGIDGSANYEQYVGSEVWQQAIGHMKIVLLYLREFFCIYPRSKFKNNLTDIFEQFLIDSEEDVFDFAQAISHAYSRLLCWKGSFLDNTYDRTNYGLILINIPMPSTIDLSNITDWDEETLVRRLPFVCHVNSRTFIIETEELEAGDMDLLKSGKHPFQLLQNHPTTLLLAYLPTSIQRLYMRLFASTQISSDETCPLPYLHLLTEFLSIIVTKERCSIRFHVLLTILSSTIKQYKMDNFLPIMTDEEMRSTKFCKQYDQSCFESFRGIVRVVESYENQCDTRELDILEERRRIENAQNDLQLYAACCCLARLVKESYGSKTETVQFELNQLWTAIQAIKEHVWRLSAAINIFCILVPTSTIQWETIDEKKIYLLRLITSLEELEPTMPLLSYVALVVRCMSFVPEGFLSDNRLIYNILQRLRTATMIEQLSICEALISLSFFRHDIFQYLRQSQCFENRVVFSLVNNYTTTSVSKYLANKFFSTSDMGSIPSTLLMSMYLSEVALYINFLDDFFRKKTDHDTVDRLSSQSLVETCLQLLDKERIELLTVQAATMISTVLSTTPQTDIDKSEIFRLEQALLTKTGISESAHPVVLEWLNYQDDKFFCSFAYQGALLLASSKIWTPTVIKICCDLLSSENDPLRDRAIILIRDRKWCSENQSISIIINWFSQWNKQETKSIAQVEHLFATLDIQTLDDMKKMMQIEREMNDVSSFRLIKSLSAEVIEYILMIIKSLTSYLPHSTDSLFLHWLLGHIPYELLKCNEKFIELFIETMLNCPNVKTKVIVAKNLIFFRNNEQVRSLLWQIIMNNEEEHSDELIAACIWSLYIKQKDQIFTEEEFKRLDYLQKYANSSCLRQAVLVGMFSRIDIQPDNYGVVDVYHSYMSSTAKIMGSEDEMNYCERASNWIIRHASVLLPYFIHDMYENFANVWCFGVSDYITVATNICAKITNEFRCAVRQTSMGEKVFRTGLYEMNKKLDTSSQYDCLRLYACFEEVSPRYIAMLMEHVMNTLEKDLHLTNLVTTLRFVSDRRSIELLFNIFQLSLSLRRRHTAAEVLLHLTRLDHVSITEVQRILTAAIEDPRSQHYLFISHYSRSTFDYELKTLLVRLLVKQDSRGQYEKKIDMLNMTTSDRIQAAVFGKFNSENNRS